VKIGQADANKPNKQPAGCAEKMISAQLLFSLLRGKKYLQKAKDPCGPSLQF
jgi:hypothetical protein